MRGSAIAALDDVDHRISILGEAAHQGVQRIETLFAGARILELSDGIKLRAAQRALDRRAPFHKDKNSIGDAVLIETFIEVASGANAQDPYAFVTHNKHDFSNMGVDEREPHPDFSEAFASKHSSYSLALGDVLSKHAPEWMDDVTWEFEFREEPRFLSEIMEAEHLLYREVWYNRHWNLRVQIDRGKHKLIAKDAWDKLQPKRRQEVTVDTVWSMALAAAKRTEDEVGLEKLGPWTDFEWGKINGKLSALRWVMGSEWDFLDT